MVAGLLDIRGDHDDDYTDLDDDDIDHNDDGHDPADHGGDNPTVPTTTTAISEIIIMIIASCL